jgi:hypothetical protein
MRSKLNMNVVKAVKPEAVDVIVWDTDVTGFGLKVTPKGNKSFFLSYRTADHRARKPKIGSFPEMKPERARQIAQSWLLDVRTGGDPSGARQAKRASRGKGTLKEHLEAYTRPLLLVCEPCPALRTWHRPGL